MGGSRPDPLAMPWETDPAPEPPGPDLATCCKMLPGGHCRRPPDLVIWTGCEHEHVGPVAACESHGAEIAYYKGALTCGLCGAPTRIIKTEPAPGAAEVEVARYG
jgi:hypothetical protein